MANLTADEIEAIVQRLLNASNTADGSTLPAQQSGVSRIPNPTGFSVLATTAFSGGASFALGWLDVQGTIKPKSYRIYAQNLLSGNAEPTFVGESSQSPCVVFVQGDAASTVVFYIQPVMSNGTRQDLDFCPTCTGSVPGPAVITPPDLGQTLIISNLTTSNNTPGAGSISWSTCKVQYNGATYNIAAGSTGNKYVTWSIGASVFVSTNTYTPGPTVFLILTNVSGAADTAWNKVGNSSINGSDIAPASITDTHINGTLSAISIAAASVDATKLNTRQLIVVSLTLTDNSPGAGQVAWSACQVFYNGNSYNITAGNTSNKYITWTVGATTFGSANSFANTPTIFLIATNTTGVSDVAWNKLGKSAVQEDNLGFALNSGYQIQNASSQVVGAVNLAPYTDTKTLLAAPSEAGYMIAAAIRVTWPGGNTYLNTFLSTAYIRIQVDGAVATDIPLYKSSASGTAVNSRWDTTAKALANDHEGTGSAVDNFLSIPLGITYKTSANVYALMVNTGDPMTNWGDGAPSVEISLIRAVKVN